MAQLARNDIGRTRTQRLPAESLAVPGKRPVHVLKPLAIDAMRLRIVALSHLRVSHVIGNLHTRIDPVKLQLIGFLHARAARAMQLPVARAEESLLAETLRLHADRIKHALAVRTPQGKPLRAIAAQAKPFHIQRKRVFAIERRIDARRGAENHFVARKRRRAVATHQAHQIERVPRHLDDVEHEAPHMHLVALAHESIVERARRQKRGLVIVARILLGIGQRRAHLQHAPHKQLARGLGANRAALLEAHLGHIHARALGKQHPRRLGVVEVRVRQKHLAFPRRHAKLKKRIAHAAHAHIVGRAWVNHQAIAAVAHDVAIRLARA